MDKSKQSPENELLKPSEAAEILRTTPGNLAVLRHTGGGPHYVKFGRAVLYRRIDIDAHLEGNLYSRTDTAVSK